MWLFRGVLVLDEPRGVYLFPPALSLQGEEGQNSPAARLGDGTGVALGHPQGRGRECCSGGRGKLQGGSGELGEGLASGKHFCEVGYRWELCKMWIGPLGKKTLSVICLVATSAGVRQWRECDGYLMFGRVD